MSVVLPEERIGTVIAGRYRISGLLGEGGMGAVFAATHEWTGRPVALKFLSPHLAFDADATQRFLQEARAAARLDHPNAVDVLDMSATEDGSIYLVLEHLEGEDLEAVLRRDGRLDVDRALDLLLPTMDAVTEAHALGIIHRDIKPANIFLARQRGAEVAKILDFGLASVRGGGAVQTQVGRRMGTPLYMAPEQIKAEGPAGPGVDVWAVGVVLFRCLSGSLPVEGPTPAAIMMSAVSEDRPKLQDVAPHVPAAVAHTIDLALMREVDERHPSMAAFAESLRRAASSTGHRARERVVGGVKDAPDMGPVTFEDTTKRIGIVGGQTGAATTPYATSVSAPEESPSRRGLWLALLAIGGLSAVATGAWLLSGTTHDADDGMTFLTLPPATTSNDADPESPAAPADPAAEREAPTDDDDATATSTLTVRANRSCILAIDGEQVGGTPVLSRPVAPGEHTLSCRPRRGPTATATVRVEAGGSIEHAFRFGRRESSDRDQGANGEMRASTSMTPDIARDYDL